MKRLALLLVLLAGCPKHGSTPPPDDDDTLPDPPGTKPEPEPKPPETELERRQYAACDRIIPRLTGCAVEDARAKMDPDEFAKLDVENTAPIHTRENLKKCKNGYMSSRQVRVYEVCDREETECGPLVTCLDNAKPENEP